MSTVNHASEIFRELRPLCIEIAREPAPRKIDALREYMQSHKSTDFTALLDYILFPLQATITRKNTSMDVKLRAIKCICVVLSGTGIARFDVFRDIFQNACFMLSGTEPGKVKDMSEEVKEVLLDCILVLLSSSSQDVLLSMYSTNFMPSVGHCISLLLNIAENDKAKHLNVKATKCIGNFVFVFNRETNKHNESFIKEEGLLSTKLASFLPGISISLSKVIRRGINQGQNVIISALEAWLSHLQIVMNDHFLPDADSATSVEDIIELMSKLTPQKEKTVSKTGSKQSKERTLEIHKDKEWYSNTSSKLKLLVEKVSGLAGHPSWKVRVALLRFAEVLLKNCNRSLACCVPCLVEIVIGFFSDDYIQVSKRSQEIMGELNMLLSEAGQASVIQLIEENLYTHFTALPRIVRSAEEENKVHALRVIVGYLHLLGNNVKDIINSGHLLWRISHAFIQVLEFDLSDIKIVEQKASQTTATGLCEKHFSVAPTIKQLDPCQYIYKKRFQHFRDDKVLDAIVKTCWYLGCYGDIVLLVDHLLDLFRSSNTNRKQVAFFINEVIRGTAGNVNNDSFNLKELPKERLNSLQVCITLILTEYLSRNVWNVQISNDEEKLLESRKEDFFVLKQKATSISKQLSFSELNSNVQLLCLLLEGIGIFATILQEQFDSMLLEVLYPLMEKLGCPNATVSQMAYWSLTTISRNCQYSSVEELLGSNVDYLINSISLNLRHISLHPDTPAVLSAMLQYGNKGLIPYLQDTLEEVLNLIDYSSSEFLLSLMRVLNSVVVAVHRWFPVEKLNRTDEIVRITRNESAEDTDLKEFFLGHLKLIRESLGDVLKEDLESDYEKAVDGEPNEEGEEQSDLKEIVPQYIKFTERVLEKCTHFLASKFMKVRLIILDTIEHGVLALGGAENQLLPMIHKLWQPMVKCFSDDELVVRTKAVSVLGTMVKSAGQFMRRRVIKDVLPILILYLVKQQAISLKAGFIYNHTQGFKFQLAILSTLGTLCRDLDVSDLDCDRVVSCLLPYLSQRQPQQLQQAAVGGLRELIDLEPDLLWLSLNDLYCPRVPEPPHCSIVAFPVVQFANDNSERNEYRRNVEKLLEIYGQ